MDTLRSNPLIDRETSGFPLSIGTGLAFETLFPPQMAVYDPTRTVPKAPDLHTYTTCWINLTTLFRNLAASCTKEVFRQARIEELLTTLEGEIEVIENLFQVEGNGVCAPLFYYSTYETYTRHPPLGVSFRTPTTEAQVFYHRQMDKVIAELAKRTDTIRAFKGSLEPKKKETALVLTHQPLDLLAYPAFTKLDLLESNTGVIKPKTRWCTKYYPMSGQSMDHLPFLRKLLLVFGDKVSVKPGLLPLRQYVMATSLKRNWTPISTEAKIMFDLELDTKDPYMLSILRNL